MKAIMNKVYSYAIEYEIVDKDYSEHVKALSQVPKTEKGIFSKAEINKLFDNDLDFTARCILILIHTGMRISELLEVKKENVHIRERYLVGGSRTEAGKNRVIPISDKIIKYVSDFYDAGATYLIENKGKKISYNSFNMRFYGPFTDKLGISHFIHETRHTFISLMDSTRCNPSTIKRIVGHQSDDVTFRYTHKTTEELLIEVNRI